MDQARRLLFWIDDFKARYLKLQVIAVVDVVDEDAQYGRTSIQISKLEFADSSGSIFSWPSSTAIAASSWTTAYDPVANILKPDFSKMCVNYHRQLPFEISIDLGEGQSIDFKKWCFYQWWTANDTQKFPSRNMRSWKLLASSDNERWVYLDEVSDFNPPAQNNTIAYISRRLA